MDEKFNVVLKGCSKHASEGVQTAQGLCDYVGGDIRARNCPIDFGDFLRASAGDLGTGIANSCASVVQRISEKPRRSSRSRSLSIASCE